MNKIQHAEKKRLFFFPTSPVHVTNLAAQKQHFSDWQIQALFWSCGQHWAKGIEKELIDTGIEYLKIQDTKELESLSTRATDLVVMGAAFDVYAFNTFCWAKLNQLKVVAIEEVAQLTLNNLSINNYDLPFDRLFVANSEEQEHFLNLSYPAKMLEVSGLLANDRLQEAATLDAAQRQQLKQQLGLPADTAVAVYTTSPLRSRLATQVKGTPEFRQKILRALKDIAAEKNVSVIIKLHPNEDLAKEQATIHSLFPEALVFGGETDILDIFAVADLVINRGNSQTALDALVCGCSLVLTEPGRTIFEDVEAAVVVNNLNDLKPTLQQALDKRPNSDKSFCHGFYVPPEGVGSFLAKQLEEIFHTEGACPDWEWTIRSGLFLGLHNEVLRLLEQLQDKSALLRNISAAIKAEQSQPLPHAEENWQKCLELEPNWFYPHFKLAYLLHRSNQFDTAAEHAQQAIELHPPCHQLWHEIPMRVLLADCLLQQSAPEASLKSLQDLEPELINSRPDLLLAKAKSCLALKRQNECVQTIGTTIAQLEAEPGSKQEDSEHYHQLGLLFAALADFPAAKNCFQQAMALNPHKVWSQYECAITCLAQEQLEEGKQLFYLALQNPLTKIAETKLMAKDLVDRYLYKVEEAQNLHRAVRQLDGTLKELDGIVREQNRSLERSEQALSTQHNSVKQLQQMICNTVTARLVEVAESNKLRIGIYGAGEHTRMLLEETPLQKLCPVALFDSNAASWGQRSYDLTISSPEMINAFDLDLLIISSFAAENEIFQQLAPRTPQKTKLLRIYAEYETIINSVAQDYSKSFISTYPEDLKQLQEFYRSTDLNTYPCPLCDHVDFEELSAEDRHNLGLKTQMCLYCGLLQHNPRPSSEWYQNFYDEYFWKVYVGSKFLNFEDMYHNDCFEEKAQYILNRALSKQPPTGTYLDIGCGLGAMLKVFRQRYPNWKIMGLEPGSESSAYAQKHTNVEIIKGYLDENTLKNLPENLNLISAIHVLEHLENPLSVLCSLREKLSDSGQMYLEVPDFFSPHWHGKDFLHLAHPLLFDNDSLVKIIHAAGLEVTGMFPGSTEKHYWPWATGILTKKSHRSGPILPVGKAAPGLLKKKRRQMESKLK